MTPARRGSRSPSSDLLPRCQRMLDHRSRQGGAGPGGQARWNRGAISVPLVPAISGLPRSTADELLSTSGRPPRPDATICKQVVNRPPRWDMILGRQLRGGRGTSRARSARDCGRSAQGRRAISVPLARVTRSQPRLLGSVRVASSAPLPGVTARLPKLIVRVRFSSPAQ